MFKWFRGGGRPGSGPDFSAIDSKAKAEVLFERGELQKVMLLPAEFGGQAVLTNLIYIPAFAAEQKASIDLNIVKPLVASGKVSRYKATPEYQGRSFIPVSIVITASEPGSFSARIAVWGNALHDTGASA